MHVTKLLLGNKKNVIFIVKNLMIWGKYIKNFRSIKLMLSDTGKYETQL